jgi:hypothetical protein
VEEKAKAMKREAAMRPLFPVDRIWPWFFWRLCVVCKREFRREYGWRVAHGPVNSQANESYVCGECAHDQYTAANFFDPARMRRPPPPPVPPRKE